MEPEPDPLDARGEPECALRRGHWGLGHIDVLPGPLARVMGGADVARGQRRHRRPINDSWIAATAIAHNIPVVTQDSDYAGMPDVEVIVI